MEWGHRFLGRIVGLAFAFPLTYFAGVGGCAFPTRPAPRHGGAPRCPGRARLVHGTLGAGGTGRERRGAASIAVPPRRAPRHRARALREYVHRRALHYRRLALRAQWCGGRLHDGRTWDGVLRSPHVRHFKTHATLVFLTALSGSSPACA